MELDGSWVLDSGASRNPMSEKKAEQHREQFAKIKERVFETAAGETISKFGVKGLIDMFQNTTIEINILDANDCMLIYLFRFYRFQFDSRPSALVGARKLGRM